MKKKILIINLVWLLLLCGGLYLYLFYNKIRDDRKKAVITLAQTLKGDIAEAGLEPGVVVKDLTTGWEFSHNKNKLFPSASLVKIPIMLAVFNSAQEGRIDLKTTLTLRRSDKVSGSGVLKDMPEGSAFNIEQLVEYMICKSDNTAANMLIDLLGFEYISGYFEMLGLKNTTLNRRMMDFRARDKGIDNYTTAEDICYVLEKLYRGKFLNSAVSEKCLALLKQQSINDRIPARLPKEIVIAHKTGLERNVCHDAGIIFTPKGDIMICVLTKNAKSHQLAKAFIATLAQDAYLGLTNLSIL